MFTAAHKSDKAPADISCIAKPIVGFYGSINGRNTVDTELIEKLADYFPDMSFVLIGKAESGCESLMTRHNIWLLGQKPYEQIPYYGKYFDVAIMPWRQNHWVDNCNPIKLKEYLAMGKPIVTTPFSQLQKYQNVVYEAKDLGEFIESIKRAFAEDSAERITARRKMVLHDSWDSKAQLVLEEFLI
jgi:glycosyltransferase involved in cell wall biosynthesis